MTNTVHKFGLKMGNSGPYVVVGTNWLTGDCSSDGEIDQNIEFLKRDLDALANEMKASLQKMVNAGLTFGRTKNALRPLK